MVFDPVKALFYNQFKSLCRLCDKKEKSKIAAEDSERMQRFCSAFVDYSDDELYEIFKDYAHKMIRYVNEIRRRRAALSRHTNYYDTDDNI